MVQKRAQAIDNATGKKLVPVQTWVSPKIKKVIIILAKKKDKTLTQYLRFLIEGECGLGVPNKSMDDV